MTGKQKLTAAAAARELGVHKSTVTRWIDSGKLPAERTPGGQWRVRAVDVRALRGIAAGVPRYRVELLDVDTGEVLDAVVVAEGEDATFPPAAWAATSTVRVTLLEGQE